MPLSLLGADRHLMFFAEVSDTNGFSRQGRFSRLTECKELPIYLQRVPLSGHVLAIPLSGNLLRIPLSGNLENTSDW